METGAQRVAVLIDADNASAAHAAAIFEEVAKHGEANIRRIYGDFSGTQLRSWVDQILPLAITARFERVYTTGKNAADIALVIDAMDLMHGGDVDMFCLVSSDSDFTGLAKRLREKGKAVIGFGERKTPEAFRNACNRFIYIENLGPTAIDPPDRSAVVATTEAEARKDPPSKATPLILRAMADLEDEEGWVMLAALGSQLVKIAPDFDPRNYGFGKLSEVVRKAGAFDIEKAEGRQLRVRQRRPRQRGA
jgi:uncharacterized protein (TIGR00288 family)